MSQFFLDQRTANKLIIRTKLPWGLIIFWGVIWLLIPLLIIIFSYFQNTQVNQLSANNLLEAIPVILIPLLIGIIGIVRVLQTDLYIFDKENKRLVYRQWKIFKGSQLKAYNFAEITEVRFSEDQEKDSYKVDLIMGMGHALPLVGSPIGTGKDSAQGGIEDRIKALTTAKIVRQFLEID